MLTFCITLDYRIVIEESDKSKPVYIIFFIETGALSDFFLPLWYILKTTSKTTAATMWSRFFEELCLPLLIDIWNYNM